jgi:hypothetical protein
VHADWPIHIERIRVQGVPDQAWLDRAREAWVEVQLAGWAGMPAAVVPAAAPAGAKPKK